MESHRDFHHPYKPYDIQVEFMENVYDCIDQRKVGIFESPTGTGKSLSLICGSMAWLRAQHQAAFDHLDDTEPQPEDEPEWVTEHVKTDRKEALLQARQDLERRLAKIRAKEVQDKHRHLSGEPLLKRTKLASKPRMSLGQDENSFVLEDYDSDRDQSNKILKQGTGSDEGLSATSLDLLTRAGIVYAPASEEDLDAPDEAKVFYCSRTHSQLVQFANEVRRLSFPPVQELGMEAASVIKHLSLGSRKNLCINPQVSKLGNSLAINESCLELQEPKTPKDHRCSFIPNRENKSLVHEFRDRTLAKVRDIEELGELGRQIGICPYYASRATVKPSEIVTLPYPLLLQKSARQALDLSLKGHVVIIDEAHNLMDAISAINSIVISLSQLRQARAQLGIYLQKFRNKLKGKNRVYVTQLVRIIDSLAGFLDAKLLDAKTSEGSVVVSDILKGKGTDQVNLYKLSNYLEESKLARKVDGYLLFIEEAAPGVSKSSSPRSAALAHIQSLLQSLTNPAAEGRFFFSKIEGNDISLKYLLLDPSEHFREIVEEARAVILAGGTMSPMEDYSRHLFPYLESSRIQVLSCSHVIPDENLIAWPISTFPNGHECEFTYEKRDSISVLDQLGKSIEQLARVIPDGLVVFFPSYSYLDQAVSQWMKSTGAQGSIWNNLAASKSVFRESKSDSSIEEVLHNYSVAVIDGAGALLLAVVGGKVSEGINFSDRLGRGVIIVGLPFPNAQSAEWVAKMQYIEQSTVSGGRSIGEGRAVARSYYENACMRAVNQSIGRAIRHKNDFAAIVMLDRRYNTERIQGKLPSWIRKGLVKQAQHRSFGEVTASIAEFFKSK